MTMRPIFASAALLLLLTGCAGQVEMQHVAGKSSAILSTYRTSVRDFAAGQNALNAANESRLVQLAKMRDMRRAEIDTRVASWRLGGDDKAVERLAILSEASADEVLANAGLDASIAVVPALAYDSSGVDAIIKQLVELQKPVSTKQRLENLLTYGEALRDAYKTAIDKAKGDGVDAANETNASAAEEETKEAAVKPGGS